MPAEPHDPGDPRRSAAQAIVHADREEAAWLAGAAGGDLDGAFTSLYRRYEGRVYGLGLRTLGDRHLAEELVQETFTRLWRGAAAYDPAKGTVRTYVLTIARRTAIGLWRRPSSRPIAPAPFLEAGAEDPFEDVLLGVTVRDALGALSAEHREVLDLCVDRDMTQAQAAEHLRVPVGTVKSRTHHALGALEAALAERGVHA
jgi:RNA polymerase sigma-70 factor (ECF subfamily)